MTSPLHVSSALAGKTALVTGAGRGLGRAIALALADAGASVWVMSRSQEQLAEVVSLIRDRGGDAVAVAGDITDEGQVKQATVTVLEASVGVDILVNNAGNNIKRPVVPLPLVEGYIAGQPGFESAGLTNDQWDSVLDTHVRGALHLIRAFVPGMLERRFGRVINIGSSAVPRSPNLVAPYKVAKGALTHLTIALAKEWAPFGVTANVIGPGHFRTEMTKALHDSSEGQDWLRERIPMRHAGDPDELGALAVHLSSDLSSFITGQTIYVDGGETL